MLLLWQLLIEMPCKLSPVRSKGDSDFLRIISSAFWSYHPLLVLLVLLKDLNRGRRTARNLPCSLDIRRSICWLSTLIFANLPLLFFLGWYQFVCFFFSEPFAQFMFFCTIFRGFSVYCNFVWSVQICIPPILVEVLAPHFAVRIYVIVVVQFWYFWVCLCYFNSPFWLRYWLRILRSFSVCIISWLGWPISNFWVIEC